MRRIACLTALSLLLGCAPSKAATITYTYGDTLTVTLTEQPGGVFLDYQFLDPLWTELDWVRFETDDATLWHLGPPAFHQGWDLSTFGFFSAAQVSRDCRRCPTEPVVEGPETGIPQEPCTKIVVGTRGESVPEASLFPLWALSFLAWVRRRRDAGL